MVGLIYTTDALNALGNYDVTGITGTVTGTFPSSVSDSPIGSLLANPNKPNPYFAPDGNVWDNNLSPTAPFATLFGIGFSFEGDELVLFSGPTGDALSEGLFSQNLQQTAIGTLSVRRVPEPATWPLILRCARCAALRFVGITTGNSKVRLWPAEFRGRLLLSTTRVSNETVAALRCFSI